MSDCYSQYPCSKISPRNKLNYLQTEVGNFVLTFVVGSSHRYRIWGRRSGLDGCFLQAACCSAWNLRQIVHFRLAAFLSPWTTSTIT
jgi:hypothetical protein